MSTRSTSASSAIPGLPGAAYSRVSIGDCASFHARPCSRPPDPISRTFMPDHSFEDSPRLVAEAMPGDNSAPESVGELSNRLKRMVEGEFGRVRLRGEISGYKRAASGHVYLCLKDDAAVIDGVMWKGQAALLPFAAQDGIEVIASGKLTTYPGRSKYQIVIDRMELAGEGQLMALFEKLKAQLGTEGLFDPARKKPLPFMPRVIGVVTSPTGAVIRDVLHRLADRCPPGGGSIEDLGAFNEEVVVRAVAGCSIPIISAVGHETDTSLCDYAADLRAPTPTAAAELAVPVLADLRFSLDAYAQRAERCARRYIERGRERVEAQA